MEAPDSAPDIVFILLDDVGFSDLGCYGSEIDTPNMDRLAGAASATRTSTHRDVLADARRLLTGRNAHPSAWAPFPNGLPASRAIAAW